MARTARWQRYWDRKAGDYDREMAFWDRRFFGDSREWACGKATGETLEVAVGTGLNLRFYPAGVTLTGVDISDGMLELARARAGADVTLKQADAHELPFGAASFDTVVCTFGLCAIPDHDRAVGEMVRVCCGRVAGWSWSTTSAAPPGSSGWGSGSSNG
jgi:ubiquinone/menaquinone biosynthesis C-methylase UbiE